jgi:KaiC/GvpD/RAD55 family RecA-like ATPase
MNLQLSNIPTSLKELPQWLMWKLEQRRGDKPTKLPYQTNGQLAKSNDAKTWATFESASKRSRMPGYSGIGFVFSEADPFIGIDLDGCREPTTGVIAEWAKEIAAKLDSYTEISPSGTGIKVFARGVWRVETGKKLELPAEAVCDKSPAIEIYDRGRYFAVTGQHVLGPAEPQERQAVIDDLYTLFWGETARAKQRDFANQTSVVERARKYVSMMPPAISGQGGHNATFRVACVLVLGFALSESEAMGVLLEWNQRCEPEWSEHELQHKVRSAAQQGGERGYLRDTKPEQWKQIAVPTYTMPRDVGVITLEGAVKKYIEKLRAGGEMLVRLGLPDVDRALGGGVDRGEVVIVAGLPSHGKSAVAMQCVHAMTAAGMPTLVISKEMPHLMLGKRSLQYISSTPEEHWLKSLDSLESSMESHFEKQAQCHIIEDVQTAEEVVHQIRKFKVESDIEVVALDYAQLIKGKGKDLREQLVNTSLMLKNVTKETGIVLILLCQLSRDIEKRPKFTPRMSDLAETSQFEKDADVILFLCWPYMLDKKQHPHDYLVFVGKNRNRGILEPVVKCKFNPSRQRLDKVFGDAPSRQAREDKDDWGFDDTFG